MVVGISEASSSEVQLDASVRKAEASQMCRVEAAQRGAQSGTYRTSFSHNALRAATCHLPSSLSTCRPSPLSNVLCIILTIRPGQAGSQRACLGALEMRAEQAAL